MIGKILFQTKTQSRAQKKAKEYRELIRKEAKLGGTIFGPIPAGHRREFFCLDEHSWVWHEEWIDRAGIKQVRNIRYDIRPNGIVKAQNGKSYTSVSPTEAKHLIEAAKIYCQRVKSELYRV